MLKNKEFRNLIIDEFKQILDSDIEDSLEKIKSDFLIVKFNDYIINSKENFEYVYERTRMDIYLDDLNFIDVGLLINDLRVKKYKKHEDSTYHTSAEILEYFISNVVLYHKWIAYDISEEDLKNMELIKFLKLILGRTKKSREFKKELEQKCDFNSKTSVINVMDFILALNDLVLNPEEELTDENDDSIEISAENVILDIHA